MKCDLIKSSVALLILFACHPGWADSANELNKRTCQVLFLNKTADAIDQAFLFDGTSSHEVTLSAKGFSNVVELPSGPAIIYFCPRPVRQPDALKAGTPAVVIPGEVNDFYLLIKAAPKDAVTDYSLELIDVSDGKLKAGETLWINYTKHNISAEIGEGSIVIPPKGRVVSPPPLEESGYYPVHFTIQLEGKGDYHSVLKRTWRFMADARSLGFVIDTSGRRPQIFTIRDRR